MDTLIGKTLSHYRVVEKIGAGGMGEVYRAADTVLNRDVALKVIDPRRGTDPEARARFLRECRLAAAIVHPHVATVYDAGQSDDGTLYFVSELVDGETLRSVLARGRMPLPDALAFARRLAEAVAAAHDRGIIHRDIKPSNIAITRNGQLKVLDFGLARLAPSRAQADETQESAGSETVTRSRLIMGSPAYMSPEQAMGLTVDERTDVFSAGAVIYEMLSGRSPFAASDEIRTLNRVVSEDPEPLEKIDSTLPPDLTRLIWQTLKKDPGERPRSARDLAAGLAAPRSGLGAGSMLSDDSTGVRHRRRRRVWALAVAAGFVLAATATAWLLTRPPIAFSGRDTLLVADVDNRTDDPVFDIALKSAIEADLQQSRYANVFDRGRISETLQLMRLGPATKVTESVGRDICRYAGLKALLLPRILSAGDVYDLYVVLIEPSTGRTVDRVRVTVRGRENVLLTAVDEVTRKVRSVLGESLNSIESTDLPVAQVTTSSWEALRDVSLAQERWAEALTNEDYRDAAGLFERALEEDPSFMAARGSLGLLLIQFLGEPDRGKELLRMALAESDSVSPRERLLIRALNEQFVQGDLSGALAQYRLISESYPDLMQPYNNSGDILRSLGRPEEAVVMFEKSARAAPESYIPLSNLYWTHLNSMRQPAAAESVARRMLAIDSLSANNLFYLGWSLVAQNRLAEAEPVLRRTLELDPGHSFAKRNLANIVLGTGRVGEAVQLYRSVAAQISPRHGEYLSVNLDLAVALRVSGDSSGADALLREVKRRMRDVRGNTSSASRRFDQARLAAARGEREIATAIVRKVLASDGGTPATLFEASRVQALLGQRDEALGLLKRALDSGYQDPYFPLVAPSLAPLRDSREFWALYPEVRRAPSSRSISAGEDPAS